MQCDASPLKFEGILLSLESSVIDCLHDWRMHSLCSVCPWCRLAIIFQQEKEASKMRPAEAHYVMLSFQVLDSKKQVFSICKFQYTCVLLCYKIH